MSGQVNDTPPITDDSSAGDASALNRPAANGRGRVRRVFWRRRPVRRTLVVTHRWAAIVLGLALLVETTAGSVLLFQPEYFHVTNQAFYQHTSSAHPISEAQAVAAVQRAHPHFDAAWVNADRGVFEVGDSDYNDMYAVDPGTGHVSAMVVRDGGLFGLLANLHECALSCAGYPGYIAALAHPVPTFGISWLDNLEWGTVILGVLGLLLLLLAVTGIITWWPGLRRIPRRFRVRARGGRFARDYDLHNAIGAIALPFLLMWGLTGSAFEFPVVQTVWLRLTGGTTPDPGRYDFTADHAAPGTPRISLAQASAIAVARVPGQATTIVLPTAQAPYYAVSISRSYDPYAYSLFRGDGYVFVDEHNAGHVKVASGGPEALSNTLYDRAIEPTHFGWEVSGWWRVIWAVFGLSPLLLAITGLSTWLVRRRSRKSRAAAKSMVATAENS